MDLVFAHADGSPLDPGTVSHTSKKIVKKAGLESRLHDNRHGQKQKIPEDGNIYVLEQENNRIQVFDNQGRFLRKWGTEGDGDGQFDTPEGLAMDAKGNVYVTDTSNNRIQVFQRVLLNS